MVLIVTTLNDECVCETKVMVLIVNIEMSAKRRFFLWRFLENE